MSTPTSYDSPLGLSSGRAILDALRADLLNDNLSEETLNNYLDNVKCLQAKQNSRLQNYGQLIDEIGFCKYLVTGTEPQRSGMCSNADLYAGPSTLSTKMTWKPPEISLRIAKTACCRFQRNSQKTPLQPITTFWHY